MTAFYDIRDFAAEHFFIWENGEDFDWLKREWHKFQDHFQNQTEAEDFILVLAYIYSAFCHESFFLKSNAGMLTIPEYVNEFEPEHPEFIERIDKYSDCCLELLLKTYSKPVEVLRELVSIAIAFELPHPDGYEYIRKLFTNVYKEPDVDSK